MQKRWRTEQMREESKEVHSRGVRREEEQDIRKAKSEHSHWGSLDESCCLLNDGKLKKSKFGKLADFTQVRTA